MSGKNEEIRKALRFDGLHEAEKVTGKSYKTDKITEAIGFMNHINNVQIKQELLESIGDSTFSNTEENYLKIVKSIGFESVLIEPFINKEGIEERFHIMWNREHSILLKFDTFTWGDDGSWSEGAPPTNVNGGNFYYNWSQNSDSKLHCTSSGGLVGNGDGQKSYSYLFNGDFTPHILPEELRSIEPKLGDNWQEFSSKYDIWKSKVNLYVKENNLITIYGGYHDCREAIKFKINQLLDNGRFVKKWVERPHLWLLHYMDTKVDGYDSYQITKERISKLPKFVTDCI